MQSSPAARAALARRSRRRWRRRAIRSPRTITAMTRRPPNSRPRPASASTSGTSPIYDACVAGLAQSRQRPRPGRRPRQQRRHHPDGMFHKMTPEQWYGGHQHQPQFAVQHVPAGHRGHARAQFRPHRQHLLDQRPEGPDGPGQLFRRQGGRHRLHQGAGAGERRQGRSPSTRSAPAISPPKW